MGDLSPPQYLTGGVAYVIIPPMLSTCICWYALILIKLTSFDYFSELFTKYSPNCMIWRSKMQNLRGDYTLLFDWFCIARNFLTCTRKFTNVHIFRKEILRKIQWWYHIFTKNHHFWENHEKHVFCHFSFGTGYKKIKIVKNAV